MRSEQVQKAIENYLEKGGKIQILPKDNRVFYFPVKGLSPAEKLIDQFAFNLFEEDERFFDILD